MPALCVAFTVFAVSRPTPRIVLAQAAAINALTRTAIIPKFLGLGVQYFHSGVNRLLQQSSDAYLKTMRQAATGAGK